MAHATSGLMELVKTSLMAKGKINGSEKYTLPIRGTAKSQGKKWLCVILSQGVEELGAIMYHNTPDTLFEYPACCSLSFPQTQESALLPSPFSLTWRCLNITVRIADVTSSSLKPLFKMGRVQALPNSHCNSNGFFPSLKCHWTSYLHLSFWYLLNFLIYLVLDFIFYSL